LPVAALVIATQRDAAIYATSGLEGSLFTLLVLAAYLLLLVPPLAPRRAAAAGLALGLAALTRPDGIRFGAVAAPFALWLGAPRGRAALAYGAALLAIVVPFAAWKILYYGDIFPNTYYAKSAMLAWYSQGFVYVAIYFARYWPLAASVPLAAWVLWPDRHGRVHEAPAPAPGAPDAGWVRAAALAAAFGLSYSWYVMRVGGDFMFARLLVPTSPFFAVLLELGLERVTPRRPWPRLVILAIVLAGMAWTPSRIDHGGWVRKIVDERDFYRRRDRAADRRQAEALRRYFAGLPVRVAIGGTQDVVAYYADPPVAIEAQAGLTDSFVAHLPIKKRGRPGHEKAAPYSYLIDRRHAHLVLTSGQDLTDTLSAYIPIVPLALGGLRAMVLTWDPKVIPELVKRGAQGPDFPARLDDYIRAMPGYSDSTIRADYPKLRRFYFAVARDSIRERPFLERLRR
jgi:hypothetical protein